MVQFFAKILDLILAVYYFGKNPIIDTWQRPKYDSVVQNFVSNIEVLGAAWVNATSAKTEKVKFFWIPWDIIF